MTSFKAIPIKFTLIGVSSDVNDEILDFREAMMNEFKSMLTLISFDIEGMKFTDVKDRFLDDSDRSLRQLAAVARSAVNFAYIEGNEEETETFNLYYDIIAVLSNSSIVPGPTVVKAVRQNRLEILQQMHDINLITITTLMTLTYAPQVSKRTRMQVQISMIACLICVLMIINWLGSNLLHWDYHQIWTEIFSLKN